MRTFAFTLLVVMLLWHSVPWLCADDVIADTLESDVVFCIGHPDAYCSEFALAKEGYAAFPQKFPNDILYEIGRSTPERDWPFLHPTRQDEHWAKGGPTHPFTIRFQSGQAIDEPTTFLIGYMGVQGDLSDVHVTVNDLQLPPQLPQNVGHGQIVHNPKQKGSPAAMSFAIPPGTIRQGDNSITVVLVGKSWILYDYVALRKEAKPLAIQKRPQPDLLTPFRQSPDGPMCDVEQIVFAVRADGIDGHWYANFGYYADDENRLPAPNNGGKLCLFDVKTRETKTLLDDPDGAVRDPQVHYNGERIVFSYRKGGSRNYHLYEIGVDGNGLKQLTDGDFDDIEPTYVADGSIIFISTRAKRWVQCWLTPVATLHACDADGGNVRQISANVEHDNTPWPMPDGRILYTRWEYVDRSQVDFHHLWVMNPDGTRQTVYYGNMHPGVVYIDAKPIPESEKIVASFSWGHGRTEHVGSIGVIDPRLGPDDRSAANVISVDSTYRDPWAFSEHAFLASTGTGMVLMDADGREQTLCEIPQQWASQKLRLHEPRPVIRRSLEPVISDSVVPSEKTGVLSLIDIYHGRSMEGVKRGEIKKLLVLETLPKPINFTGGMEPLSYGGSFTLERIVGTVPVEQDGSAHFELPAMRSFFFVALDENDMAIKRMQSFMSVMPGESLGCVGCHENRTEAPFPANDLPLAMRRGPSPVTPVTDYQGLDYAGNRLAAPPNIPDVIDFPRDVQPILDRHCVACHSPEKREGGISLVGDRTPLYSISYYTITAHSLVADGRNLPKGNYPPRTLGSSASRLMQLCDGTHYDAKLSDREKTILRFWIETGATYPGTYAGLGSGMVGGYAENQLDRQDTRWPEVQAMTKTMQENCVSCHTAERNMLLPLSPSDEIGGPPWEVLRPNDVRRKYSRQLLYNLTNPEKSTLLLAPLAKEDGGYGACGQKVFNGKDDPNYQAILAGIQRTKQHLDEIKRFDMQGFVPRPQYVRELKKYEILPQNHSPQTVVNPYQLEQMYWRSLW